MSEYDIVVSVALGVGLAAAVGFRVFLPLLVMGGAAYTGHLTLSDGLQWLATPTALAMLSVAAIAEILAYYIPGVDNLLDAIATPTALVAGTIAAAAVMTDLPPIVKWTTAVIAGAARRASPRASPRCCVRSPRDDGWARQRRRLDERGGWRIARVPAGACSRRSQRSRSSWGSAGSASASCAGCFGRRQRNRPRVSACRRSYRPKAGFELRPRGFDSWRPCARQGLGPPPQNPAFASTWWITSRLPSQIMVSAT